MSKPSSCQTTLPPPQTPVTATATAAAPPLAPSLSALPSLIIGSGSSSQSPAAVSPAPGSPPLPEAAWLPFIEHVYPDRHNKTYFLPPVQFNRQHYTVDNIAGEPIAVMREHPQGQGQGRSCSPPLTNPEVAGSMFTFNPPGLQPSPHQDTDMQDDQAQHHTLHSLRALSDNDPQVMVVVSQLLFRQYLDNVTNPVAAAAAALPRVQQLSPQLGHGECDVLILHREKGVIVGEIKSVGASAYIAGLTEGQRQEKIARRVAAAVKQLNNQGQVLEHLVQDLKVRVTKTLILPYVSSAQLLQAVHGRPEAQDLCQCVGARNLQEAVDRCLCEDRMPSTAYLHISNTPTLPSLWSRLRAALRQRSTRLSGQRALRQMTAWLRHTGNDPNMTSDRYDRLLARFCGPATTVDVYTPTRPRLVIRTEAEAVAETGLRVSRLALTPDQVDLLGLPDRDLQGRGIVYLHAPPGCGKTLLLYLKARQWLNKGRHVHVVCISNDARAVSSLLTTQLRQRQGMSAVTSHTFDFPNKPDDVPAAVAALVGMAMPGEGVHVIVDEADSVRSGGLEDLCRDLHQVVPDTCLWAAGVTRLSSPLPCIRVVDTLTTALRCPPVVQRQVERSTYIDGSSIPHYSKAEWPSPTDGPPIRWLEHGDEDGHDGSFPHECEQCGLHVGRLLHDLVVGQSGLKWKDVFILSEYPSHTTPFVEGLKQASVPVVVVENDTATENDCNDLAAAVTDKVTIADYDCVRGLERRVVVGFQGYGSADRLQAMSRCTGLLVWIGTPNDF